MSHSPAEQSRQQLWLLHQEGRSRESRVAEVALRLRTHKLYTFEVPEALQDEVAPGALLEVPQRRGSKPILGWCVGVSTRPYSHTRQSVRAVAQPPTVLDAQLIELALWIAHYYHCPPAQVIDAIVPAPVRNAKPAVRKLLRAKPAADTSGLTEKQVALLNILRATPRSRKDACAAAGVTPAVLRKLLEADLVEEVTERVAPPTAVPASSDEPPFKFVPEDEFALTPGQSAAINALTSAGGEFRACLLFGVPGSGKTEVYVRAMQHMIASGRQCIVVVPEIALATQVVERLAQRFRRAVVLHSRLTGKHRRETLHAIKAGRIDVVIGTRTAVFAPCPALGLIVVDEEQESSLKNLQAPFFHARDVALKRAQLLKIPCVLGSATPSLETWFNATQHKHFTRLVLPERVPGAILPTAKLISAEPSAFADAPILSRPLLDAIQQTLADREQVILLHNRRGYATLLRCQRCGLVVRCERCATQLVFHAPGNELKCHRCGWKRSVPEHCLDDTCSGPLVRSGMAIQRLEEELKRRFPEARLQRLDSDAMKHREDYAAALTRFTAREADILLGTQMVAKGLDFPAVRLVGVLEADASLSLPDLRANESTFQLLMQVVGRAGRSSGESLALLQAENTRHHVLQAAIKLDYPAFADHELTLREAVREPPYARLIRLVLLDPKSERAAPAAEQLAQSLRAIAARIHADIRVDDAMPCVIPRLRELLRYQVLIRLPRALNPGRFLDEARAGKLLNPRVARFTIDVDPVELM